MINPTRSRKPDPRIPAFAGLTRTPHSTRNVGTREAPKVAFETTRKLVKVCQLGGRVTQTCGATRRGQRSDGRSIEARSSNSANFRSSSMLTRGSLVGALPRGRVTSFHAFPLALTCSLVAARATSRSNPWTLRVDRSADALREIRVRGSTCRRCASSTRASRQWRVGR